MLLRIFPRLVLLLVAGLLSACGGGPVKPNFVIMLADDLGYADLGCFGSKDIRTPRLDQMAREGMRFGHFYAQTMCGPSRAALLTGCYPMRVAERGNIKRPHPALHRDEVTLAEILKGQGYVSGCFGKWDLAGHSNKQFFPELLPLQQGFETHFGTPTSNDSRQRTVLMRDGAVIEEPANFSTLTKRYTDEAIEFMTKHRERPFFVYIPHTMPHTELDASEGFKGKSKRGVYGDTVEEIDHNVGRVLDALKKLGLDSKTYVLFTSDNGPWLSKNADYRDGSRPLDHGGSAGPLRSGKLSSWEGGFRVPTIFWAPGRVAAGADCSALASTLDILPTFAALAGGAPPGDRTIDGEDIGPLLASPSGAANRDKVFYYYVLTHLQAVRQGKWKLHLPRPQDPHWHGPFSPNLSIAPADRAAIEQPMLVDLEADEAETTNVAGQHPEVVRRLLALAEQARQDIGDHDRVGKNMRFFDPLERRPEKPITPWQ